MDAASLGSKAVRKTLEGILDKHGIVGQRKTIVLFLYDNSSMYVTWCYSNRKDPTSRDALKDFLEQKGVLTAKFVADMGRLDWLGDALALLVFFRDLQKDAKWAELPVVGIAVLIGLYIQDLGKFLADFTPAQRAYYELVLKRF